jgi:uncharacterized RDD family membrane protein YckC
MSIPILHIFWKNNAQIPRIQSATFRQRIVAQLIDGIILGIIISFSLVLLSKGKLYSVWISPLLPIFVVQSAPDFIPKLSSWWWGGYFATISLPFISDFKLSLPNPLQWIIYAIYYILFNYYYGQTPGKMVKGMVILSNSQSMLTFYQSVLRWLTSILSASILGFGFWKNMSDKTTKAWHDKKVGTEVYSFLDFDN